MMSRLFVVAFSTALLTTPTLAQEGLYGTLGYAAEEVSDADAEFGSVQGRLGYRFAPHFGVEAEFGYGIRSDTPAFAQADLEGQAAAYLVGYLPVTPRLDLFARIGAGVQEISGDNICIAVSVVPGPSICTLPEADRSLNIGAGAIFMLDEKNSLRADWTRKDYDDAGLQSDVWSVAFQRRF